MIRIATAEDASRIAEILVFSKRKNYRRIFRNDRVSFGEIQVYPLAKRFIETPELLKNIRVYDDGFVKGLLHVEGSEIKELYVDPFFEGNGIGGELISFAIDSLNCDTLWVLEKNTAAIRFYERHGFHKTSTRKQEEGTTEYLIRMQRPSV